MLQNLLITTTSMLTYKNNCILFFISVGKYHFPSERKTHFTYKRLENIFLRLIEHLILNWPTTVCRFFKSIKRKSNMSISICFPTYETFYHPKLEKNNFKCIAKSSPNVCQALNVQTRDLISIFHNSLK